MINNQQKIYMNIIILNYTEILLLIYEHFRLRSNYRKLILMLIIFLVHNISILILKSVFRITGNKMH